MAWFRKRPLEIEAEQWLDTDDSFTELVAFTGYNFSWIGAPGGPQGDYTARVYDKLHDTWVKLRTGDWVIRGVSGEFYPCEAEVFAATYTPTLEFLPSEAEVFGTTDETS